MTVTEIALLRLKPDIDLKNASLLAGLRKAKSAMESNTGFTFWYLTCVEDPTLLYIFGEWKSARSHWEDWIPSPANQELVELLTPFVDIEWMFHIGVEQRECPLNAPVVAIGRHNIKEEDSKQFERVWRENVHHLKDFADGDTVGGGWRIERDALSQGSREFVVLSGWTSRDRHGEFATTDRFKEYSKIRDYVQGFQVHHLTQVDM